MIYLICSHSCLSQMEIAYLMNNSPDFFGEQPHDENWASYELNGKDVDGEHGYFGTVRVHDDYWNIDDEDKNYYNFEVRNTMNLSYEQFKGLLHFEKKYKNIALLLHAHNLNEIDQWCRDENVKLIGAGLGLWEKDIEYWAMREFNEIMEDSENANYTDSDHYFKDISDVVDAFEHKQSVDIEWLRSCIKHCWKILIQDEWQDKEKIQTLWFKLGIAPPSDSWIKEYYTNFQNKQIYNTERLQALREEYERRQ